jgi:hypothetical protein
MLEAVPRNQHSRQRSPLRRGRSRSERDRRFKAPHDFDFTAAGISRPHVHGLDQAPDVRLHGVRHLRRAAGDQALDARAIGIRDMRVQRDRRRRLELGELALRQLPLGRLARQRVLELGELPSTIRDRGDQPADGRLRLAQPPLEPPPAFPDSRSIRSRSRWYSRTISDTASGDSSWPCSPARTRRSSSSTRIVALLAQVPASRPLEQHMRSLAKTVNAPPHRPHSTSPESSRGGRRRRTRGCCDRRSIASCARRHRSSLTILSSGMS